MFLWEQLFFADARIMSILCSIGMKKSHRWKIESAILRSPVKKKNKMWKILHISTACAHIIPYFNKSNTRRPDSICSPSIFFSLSLSWLFHHVNTRSRAFTIKIKCLFMYVCSFVSRKNSTGLAATVDVMTITVLSPDRTPQSFSLLCVLCVANSPIVCTIMFVCIRMWQQEKKRIAGWPPNSKRIRVYMRYCRTNRKVGIGQANTC